MAAGGSAEEEARRHRERARRAERMAEAWERGAEGERRVAGTLRALPPEFVVFHDLRLPAPSKANVDHVVVGPNGIVAIDTKNYSHPVTRGTGKGSDTLWTGRYPMRKELGVCAWEAAAVSDLIGYPVEPMMCIIAPSVPAGAFDFAGVRVCTPASLVTEVRGRRAAPVDVAAVSAVIAGAFDTKPEARRMAQSPPPPRPAAAAASVAGPSPSGRRTTRWTLERMADSRLVRVVGVIVAFVIAMNLLAAVVGLVSGAMGDAASGAAERMLERSEATTTIVQASTSPTTVAPTTVAPTTVPPTTVPEVGAPPAVDVVLTCPTAGSMWQMSWIWPGDLPDGAVGYMVRTQQGDGPLFTHSWGGWKSPDEPPRPIDVPPGSSFTIVTDYLDGWSKVVGRTEELFVAPLQGC